MAGPRRTSSVEGGSRRPSLKDWYKMRDKVRGGGLDENVGIGEVPMASGFLILGTARGVVVMSNVFLSTALIYLASEEVGCIKADPLAAKDSCDERIYGVFKPAALVTNIAVISGFLSALLMPVTGAWIDFTSHRWTVGVMSSLWIVVIQLIQIGTNSDNWFAMSLLMAVWGCLYQVLTLASYAYLPDIARLVPEKAMARFTSYFIMAQFGAQTIFLCTVVCISFAMELDDVQTAKVSQAINGLFIIIPFVIGWSRLPRVGARHELEEGKSLLLEGFCQNWRTAKLIRRDYGRSLYWFLWGVLFAEPAAEAFTKVAIVYLNDLELSSAEIGIFFFLAVVAVVPGGLIANALSQRTNANTSLRVSLLTMFILCLFGGLGMTPQNAHPVTFIWGAFLGLALGTYYPSVKLFLSLVIPKSQEAEIVGFYQTCAQLLAWLPPLIFSWTVEAGLHQGIGLISLGGFFLLAIPFFSMAAPFDELVQEVRSKDNNKPSASSAQTGIADPEKNEQETTS